MNKESIRKVLLAVVTLFVLSMLFWGVVCLSQISESLRGIEGELHSIEWELSGIEFQLRLGLD